MDDQIARKVRQILKKDYPFLFDKRVRKFIDFLQLNYELVHEHKFTTAGDSTDTTCEVCGELKSELEKGNL
jgi:hypothetical protein